VTDDATLDARMLGGMEAFFGLAGDTSRGGFTIRRDGVLASVCPEMPHRSVFNSVVYRSTAALQDALDELTATYAQAGVAAWTVWTPQRDADAREAVRRAGHRLDATPQAMAAPLDEIDLAAGARGLEWRRADGVEEMCAILGVAFGWEPAPASAVFARLPECGEVYVASIGGLPAACVSALDAGGDCAIFNVGTLPQARGRGLCTGLMRQALADARRRGCTTTSLQATAVGRPIYARLGYRELGVIEMWERRRGGADGGT
jgi:ribosomal protein S18 acetylase RimI-like enzyme